MSHGPDPRVLLTTLNGATTMTRRAAKVADPAQYLPLLARAAAKRARRPKEPLSRSEALAAAPWDTGTMPPAWERAFREAYADRLEELGSALPAAKSGSKSRVGGGTDLERLVVYVSRDEERQHRATAKAEGLSLSTWARRKLAT